MREDSRKAGGWGRKQSTLRALGQSPTFASVVVDDDDVPLFTFSGITECVFFLNVIIVMKIHVHVVGFVFVSLISFLTLERICGCLFWMWCKLSAVLRWSSCLIVMDSSPFCGSNCFYFIYCIPVTSQTAITSPNMSYRVQLQYYWNTCCNNKHHDRRTVRWLQNFWYSTTIPFCPAELTCVCVF